MLSEGARSSILRVLGHSVVLLTDGAEITDAGQLPVDLREKSELRFGPARRDWRVTGFALVDHQGRRVTRTIRTQRVLEGQCLDLTIVAGVNDE